MANNVEEALQEAIDEIKSKDWVEDAEYFLQSPEEENKPCGYIAKLINIMHQTVGAEGYTFSHKLVYINKADYTYKWHYGGPQLESAPTPLRDFLESKLDNIKTSMGLDWVGIIEINELEEHAKILAIKTTTGNNADTYTVKIWKTGPTTFDYKIVNKTTVE